MVNVKLLYAKMSKFHGPPTSKELGLAFLPSSLSICKKYVGNMPRSIPFLSLDIRHFIVVPWVAGLNIKDTYTGKFRFTYFSVVREERYRIPSIHTHTHIEGKHCY